mmetsp:Transcript_32061/g.52972  ORF Transcript_32061/g.52972 Transcript_32061/m.52972 type:complete len:211 (+) Transcript_32061:27-659(+)
MSSRVSSFLMFIAIICGILVPNSAFISTSRPTAASWRSLPLMQIFHKPIPPAPPQTGDGGGGGGGDGLILRTISADVRRAALTLWQWQLQQQPVQVAGSMVDPLVEAKFLSEWRGDESRAGCCSLIKGRALGAYIGERLEGLVGIHYEIDSSDWMNALRGKHMMVVDVIVIGPAMPARMRALFHACLVRTLLQLGQVHTMNVVMKTTIGT